MSSQFKVQRISEPFGETKFVVVRYADNGCRGIDGETHVADIYDIPHQKAPKEVYDLCEKLMKIKFANRPFEFADLPKYVYGMIANIEDTLTEDAAISKCEELRRKYENHFVASCYWEASRQQKEESSQENKKKPLGKTNSKR